MQAFNEVRFPEDISYGSVGGPCYATDIASLASGGEQRNINWMTSRARYNLAPAIKDEKEMRHLLSFFHAHRGKAIGFRFKDWCDFTAKNQQIGVGDGERTDFQLIKTYESGGAYNIRIIHKPILDTVKVYLDNKETDKFKVSAGGVVSFSSSLKSGVVITADFEFDVPVRFDCDYLPISIEGTNYYLVGEVPLVEIRI